jgi:putative inorganic carbon (HCO3(-)) transporter
LVIFSGEGAAKKFYRACMTITLKKTKAKAIQYALFFSAGILTGEILLLDISLKWEIVLLAVLGTAVLIMTLGIQKRILLFMLAFIASLNLEKSFIDRPGHLGLATGVDIKLVDLLALALLLLFIARVASRQVDIHWFPFITIPALAWIVFSSLSLIAARDEGLVVLQLINMAKLLILCWIIANSVNNEGDVIYLIAGMMLGMLFQSTLGIYQGLSGRPGGFYFLDEINELKRQELNVGFVNRVQGTIGHPNSYAMYLITVIPFAFAFLFSRIKKSSKVLVGITLCLSCLALIFSLARAAWINLLVVFTLVVLLAVRRKRISLRGAVWIASMAFLILLGLTLFGPDIILSRLLSSDQGSAYSRITLAQTALAIIKSHPWVGVGLNNYSLFSHQYGANVFGQQFLVHNAFLLIGAETGLMGLTAFVAFLVVMLTQAWKAITRAPNNNLWAVSVGAFCALVAFALYGIVDYAVLSTSQVITQFWLLAGISASLIQRVDHDKRRNMRITGSPIFQ